MQPMMKRGRRGFTLPEVLVAMTLVGAAVSVFGAAFPACSYTIQRSRATDMAADACQQRMDMYRSVGHASLPAIPDGQTSLTQGFSGPAGLPAGAGSVTFTRVDAAFSPVSTETGRVQVRVQVSWAGRGTNRGAVSVTSLIVQ